MTDADAAFVHVTNSFGLPDPFADAGGLAAREEWRRDLAPEGAYAEWVTRLAAAASLRMEQSVAKESALIAHQTTRARLVWDEDRSLDAEALGSRLARTKSPAVVRRRLEQTYQGAGWTADRWAELAEAAGSGTTWSPAERGRACRLLGTVPADADGLPATAETQAALAWTEIARIEELREGTLRLLDDQERELAEQGLSLVPSPPLAHLQRERARWSRLLSWSLRELRRVAREAARAGGPAAPPAPAPPPTVAPPPPDPFCPAPPPLPPADDVPGPSGPLDHAAVDRRSEADDRPRGRAGRAVNVWAGRSPAAPPVDARSALEATPDPRLRPLGSSPAPGSRRSRRAKRGR